jgi:hypothetical protein
MEMGAHTRGRGGQVFPTPPMPKAQSRCPSTPLSLQHLLPPQTTQKSLQSVQIPSLPPAYPPPVFPLTEALSGRFGRPFSDPPRPRSLATYGSKKNQKKHLKTIDIRKSPLRNWGWRGVSALRSLETEDSAVFLMAGLCPFILRQFCPVAFWSASTVHGIQFVL